MCMCPQEQICWDAHLGLVFERSQEHLLPLRAWQAKRMLKPGLFLFPEVGMRNTLRQTFLGNHRVPLLPPLSLQPWNSRSFLADSFPGSGCLCHSPTCSALVSVP